LSVARLTELCGEINFSNASLAESLGSEKVNSTASFFDFAIPIARALAIWPAPINPIFFNLNSLGLLALR